MPEGEKCLLGCEDHRVRAGSELGGGIVDFVEYDIVRGRAFNRRRDVVDEDLSGFKLCLG